MSFTTLGLYPNLQSHLHSLGYTKLAPAHAQLLPPILKGENILVSCAAGAGCTEAGLIALIHLCLQSHSSDNTVYLILTPSDAHTNQMAERVQSLAGNSITVKILTDTHLNNLKDTSAPRITIGTPEHVLAQLLHSDLHTTITPTLLLSQTDEIIAHGSKTALLNLGEVLNSNSQVIIYATHETRSVSHVSKALQRKLVRQTIKPDGEHPESIPQQAWPVPAHLKTSLLVKLQRRIHPASILVIIAEESTAGRVARRLRTVGTNAAALLNSDSTKREEAVTTRFQKAEIKLLLLSGKIPASLRVEEVTHVINYNLPSKNSIYFHALRRFPQAVHINLVEPRDEEHLLEIEDILGRPLARDWLHKFDYSIPDTKTRHAHRPPRGARSSGARVKQRHTTKTKWDPEIPRTWGDRNAPRKMGEKIPLAEWSPEPLPPIWFEQEPSTKRRSKKITKRRGGRQKKN